MTATHPTRSRGRLPRDHSPEALRRHRVASGLSRPALAKAAGISPSHLAELENNTRNAGPRTLVALAEALGVPASDLMPPARS
ncbi:helix-turn-helix transcriptional regulator [Solwaraspora sp. WMMD792]|uniref:helix-turn-helix domain-containing protein n=1 Tax=Solwaraspora sp. WMMD792 TaxID=3016099 RepID=UPI00241731B6|nr:helix-turn-helix transcriptional regulator [Solwaraspora sp. WMMD792]MDG4768862.1 helix-turn-helix transcriptional regulator [Solwaraspora sp. WMMD792]MDG4769033.1 helix-turn-helix transcriptional regulator [Solwaraspora sp. WMMD792]